MQTNVIIIRITSLYGSQPSSVFFSCKRGTFGSELQLSMGPRLRLLSWECKTACLDPEWRLSIGPSLHLWFCAFKNSDFSIRITGIYVTQPSSVVSARKTATLEPELQVSMGPRPHLFLLLFKTETLAPELQVSIGPSPHLWFVHAKQRLLDQNYKSLWVPAIICSFVHSNLWL